MRYCPNYIFAFLFVLSSSFLSLGQADSTSVSDTAVVNSEINWLSMEEAYELNKTNPKKWMIDVSTEWCGWCKRMDATTFSDPIIIKYVNENYYAVALDGEEKEDIVLDSTTFKFVAEGRRGYNELPATLMQGKMSYPTIIFMNSEMQVYQALPGYKSNKDLHPILIFIQDFEKNPNRTWEAYMETYVSPYPKE